jgi:hypothetical protein
MLAAVLKNAAANGVFKFDSDARPGFAKWVGGLDQAGAVTKAADTFNKPGLNNFDYFGSRVARLGPNATFEQLLFAFMIHIAGQCETETREKMKQLEGKDHEFDPKTGAKHGAAGTPGLSASAQKGVESTLKAIDKSLKNDGAIDATEAAKIQKTLDKLDPSVKGPVATAFASSLRRSGMDLGKPEMKPLTDWVKSVLGDKTDLSPLPQGDASKAADDAMSNALLQSPKLEDKIAGYLTGVLMSSDKSVGDKLKGFKDIAGPTAAATPTGPQEANDPRNNSRAVLMEELKFKINERSEIMQAISGILNSCHALVENATRAIR